MEPISLTNRQARRFVLLWQGLLGPRRFKGADGALAFVRQAGCVQFDPVDVCGKNADITLFARVGGYKPEVLHRLLYKKRALVDHWDKNMSIYPTEDWPRFARNRQNFRGWSYTDESRRAVEEALPGIRAFVHKRGVACSADIDTDVIVDWPWAPAKLSRAALEYLYFTGELVIHHRKGAVRHYAPAQNHLPDTLLAAPDPCPGDADFYRWATLRRIASAGLLWNRPSDAFLAIPGYGKEPREAAFAALLAGGDILECAVEGIAAPLYCPAAAEPFLRQAMEGKVPAKRLEFLAPLDNLMWDRKLVKALFGFDYKWEIYTPAQKRQYCPYALPVLWGEGFAGRADLLADRANGVLHAKHFWPEPKARLGKAFWAKMEKQLAAFARLCGCAAVECGAQWPRP